MRRRRNNAAGPIREEGTTPLLAALYHINLISPTRTEIAYNPNPNPSIVRALLDKGANVNATDQSIVKPIELAVTSGSIEVVDLLLKHGARVNLRPPWLLLHRAASQGRVKMMRFLMDQGADINALDPSGQTALVCTVRFARQPDAVRFLLDRHIDVNVKDSQGHTALFYAQTPPRWLAPSQSKRLPDVIALLKKAGAK